MIANCKSTTCCRIPSMTGFAHRHTHPPLAQTAGQCPNHKQPLPTGFLSRWHIWACAPHVHSCAQVLQRLLWHSAPLVPAGDSALLALLYLGRRKGRGFEKGGDFLGGGVSHTHTGHIHSHTPPPADTVMTAAAAAVAVAQLVNGEERRKKDRCHSVILADPPARGRESPGKIHSWHVQRWRKKRDVTG